MRLCRKLTIVACLLASLASLQPVYSDGLDNQKVRGRAMLKVIRRDIETFYFDPNFKGLNLDALFKDAEDQINHAISGDQIFGIIARMLLTFNDSHTNFMPPSFTFDVEYGWEMELVGDKCYVIKVDPSSDAMKKGLKPGDEILSVFDVVPTRENLWEIEYLFTQLRPVSSFILRVQTEGGQPRKLEVLAKVSERTWNSIQDKDERQRQKYHQYYFDYGDDLFIWKMTTFHVENDVIDGMMKKVGKRKALIIDLRGNGGGYEFALQRLVGHFFDEDVRIGDHKGRKGTIPFIAKALNGRIFAGRLVVLVDADSMSASEVFARTIQLQKRGVLVGDRTYGAVMTSRKYYHTYDNAARGMTRVVYGVSVTVQDIIFSDGVRLERVGVMPDEFALPKQSDLATGRDPALSRAMEICGVRLDPVRAGALELAE